MIDESRGLGGRDRIDTMRTDGIHPRRDREAPPHFNAKTFLGVSALFVVTLVTLMVYAASPL